MKSETKHPEGTRQLKVLVLQWRSAFLKPLLSHFFIKLVGNDMPSSTKKKKQQQKKKLQTNKMRREKKKGKIIKERWEGPEFQ